MARKDEIKELFQNNLGNYKAKVDSKIWHAVQSQIGAVGTATSTSIGLVGKIALGITAATVITVATIFIVKNQQEQSPKKIIKTNEILNSNDVKIDTVLQQKKITKQQTTNKTKNYNQSQKKQKKNSPVTDEINQNIEKIDNNSVVKQNDTSSFTQPIIQPSTSSPSKKTTGISENNNKEKVDFSNVKIKLVQQDNQFVKLTADNIPTGSLISWNFGDGNFGHQQQIEHYYENKGNYEVTLVVKKGQKTIKKTIDITIKVRGEIGQLPNIFTPNGDGKNDIFFIKNKNLASFQITIMDMHQKTVFSTNNPHFEWRGIGINGQPVPAGKYFYIIVATDISGNTINKYQQLTIQR